MRQADVKKQFEAALSNVQSTLEDLSERLDDLGGKRRRRRAIHAAGERIRHTADSVAHSVPVERASRFATNTTRSARHHPVTTALAAAIAGYCVWSVLRFANERSRRISRMEPSERYGDAAETHYPRGEYLKDTEARH